MNIYQTVTQIQNCTSYQSDTCIIDRNTEWNPSNLYLECSDDPQYPNCIISCTGEDYSCGSGDNVEYPTIICPLNGDYCIINCIHRKACSGSSIESNNCSNVIINIYDSDNKEMSVYAPGNHGTLQISLKSPTAEFKYSFIYTESTTKNISFHCNNGSECRHNEIYGNNMTDGHLWFECDHTNCQDMTIYCPKSQNGNNCNIDCNSTSCDNMNVYANKGIYDVNWKCSGHHADDNNVDDVCNDGILFCGNHSQKHSHWQLDDDDDEWILEGDCNNIDVATTTSTVPTSIPTIESTYSSTVEPTDDMSSTPILTTDSDETIEPTYRPTVEPTLQPTDDMSSTPILTTDSDETIESTDRTTEEPTLQPTDKPSAPISTTSSEITLTDTEYPTDETTQSETENGNESTMNTDDALIIGSILPSTPSYALIAVLTIIFISVLCCLCIITVCGMMRYMQTNSMNMLQFGKQMEVEMATIQTHATTNDDDDDVLDTAETETETDTMNNTTTTTATTTEEISTDDMKINTLDLRISGTNTGLTGTRNTITAITEITEEEEEKKYDYYDTSKTFELFDDEKKSVDNIFDSNESELIFNNYNDNVTPFHGKNNTMNSDTILNKHDSWV